MTTKEELMTVINKSFEEQKKRPGVVALEGPWGCGKSFLLNDVLNEWVNQTPFDPFRVVVTYNAWEDDSGEKPIVPVLLKLVQEIDQIDLKNEGLFGDYESLALTDALIDGLECFPPLTPVAGVIKMVRRYNNKIKTKGMTDSVPGKAIMRVEGWSDLYKRLGEVMDSDSAAHYKVILVVDDLDRVISERQIDLLESLYHLSQSMRVLVLVAYDFTQLSESVEKHFGKGAFRTYTQKMFSCTLNYQKPETNTLYKALSETMLCNHSSSEHLIESDLRNLLSGFSITNRNLKRLDIALRAVFESSDVLISPGVEGEMTLIIFIAKELSVLSPISADSSGLRELIKQIIYSHNPNARFYTRDVLIAVNSILGGFDRGVSDKVLSILRTCTFEGLDSRVEVERQDTEASGDRVEPKAD